MERDAARPERGPLGSTPAPQAWWRRAAWLVGIWAASVVALGVAAYAFRIVMGWAGLTR